STRGSAAVFGRVGGGRCEFSIAIRFEAPVERRARDAEELRGLGDVSVRDLERGLEVGLLDALQRRVEAEGFAGKQIGARLGGEGRGRLLRRGRELGLELAFADRVPGM